MKKAMNLATAISALLTVVFAVLVLGDLHWAVPFAVTFGTFFYHFAMRLMVGHGLNQMMGNRVDCTKAWYQLRPFERKLYQILKVKKWKNHMPSYEPGLFDPSLHNWEEIAQAMCQAEIVHEVIAALSFLPLIAAIPFGEFPVFFLTSLLSAGFDLCFVIMQRFNRPRVIRLLEKERTVK